MNYNLPIKFCQLKNTMNFYLPLSNKKTSFLLFLLCFFQIIEAQQTIHYPLHTNFEATDPTAPDLSPLANSNGQTGNFTSTTLNGDLCSEVNSIPAYFFEDNTGLRFDNSNHFLDCAYTIEFVYQFTDYLGLFDTGWLWLLGFTNVQDDGIFIYQFPFLNTTSLEFWDDNTLLATVGQANTFVEDRWYKIAVTRDCNNLVSIYVNGNFFGSYNDVNGIFRTQPNSGNQIIFFQDNPAVLSSESSPGHVREINISNYTKSATDIANSCECLCDILAEDCNATVIQEEMMTCNPDEVGVVSDTIAGTCGCDQITMTTFVWAATPDVRDTFELCSGESILIEGIEVSSDTTICQSTTNEFGCETNHCSTVFVIPIKETEIEAQICSGESYEYEGIIYTETGLYVHTQLLH